MDMNIFRKSLAKNSKVLKEESSLPHLKSANKTLYQAEKLIEDGIDHLQDYIIAAEANKEVSTQDRIHLHQLIKELNDIKAKLLKTVNNVPG